ncbi:MAG: membrane dipeptidase, partial [Oscillospiraceae bacterium]
MFTFDLHCDTAFEMFKNKQGFLNNGLCVDLAKLTNLNQKIQTFAFWIDDIYSNDNAFSHFCEQYNYFLYKLKLNSDYIKLYDKTFEENKLNAILSVENGRVLQGDIKKIATLKKMGISFLSLVWNGENEIGSGMLGSGSLTDFGKQAVRELENTNIIVDVSHLNERGFYDVCEIATKPLIASHSNSAAVHDHPRNLSDEQLNYIINNHGLCGINFYPLFVNGKSDCEFSDLTRHVEHILSLGGENILALGSDFDGALMPKSLNCVSGLEKYRDYMLKYYSEE